MSEEGPVAFEVLDAFEGLFRLVRRSPTLDGAVPVRVAQACMPLLEGNAFGFQLELTRALSIERRIGRAPRLNDVGSARVSLEKLHVAALPRLVAHGIVNARSTWHRAFAERPFCIEKSILWLWTGLLVRAEPGVSLRVSATANRRNVLVDIEEVFVEDDDSWIPLLLGITPHFPKGAASIRLEGELATVAPMMPEVAIEKRALADAKDLGEAHVEFYDAAYFATKRGEVTKKYRRLIKRAPRTTNSPPHVAPVGPCELTIERAGKRLAADRLPSKSARVTSILFRNPLEFRAVWDGHTVTLSYDANELKRLASEVERTFTSAYGGGFVEKHRGAIWYLTKFFTPHPPGEPHFFVKPWAFVRTPASWSCLLEGVNGDGYDVMRGVVASDSFHAAPAVFLLRRLGEPVHVARGAPLLRVFPIPRRLLSSGFRVATWPRP
jgi:hypothetical protein